MSGPTDEAVRAVAADYIQGAARLLDQVNELLRVLLLGNDDLSVETYVAVIEHTIEYLEFMDAQKEAIGKLVAAEPHGEAWYDEWFGGRVPDAAITDEAANWDAEGFAAMDPNA